MKSILLFILILFAILCSTNPKYWIFITIIGIVLAFFGTQGLETFDVGDNQADSVATNQVSAVDVDNNEESVTTDDIHYLKPHKTATIDNVDIIYNLMKSNPQLSDADGHPTSSHADDLLYLKSKQMAQQAKESQDIRIRYTSGNMAQYFQEELDEQEHRDWWGNDDKLDQRMTKDGINFYTMPF